MQLHEELQVLNGRITVFATLITLAFGILAFGFLNYQVFRSLHYRQLAERNMTRTRIISAPRGSILDREYRVVADTRPSYNLVLKAESGNRDPEETIGLLAGGIQVSEQALLDRFKSQEHHVDSRHIVLADDLALDDIAYLKAHSYELPEIFLEFQPLRRYRGEEVAAHLIGYLGEIGQSELGTEGMRERQSGDIVGKSGLERQYDSLLRGRPGIRRLVVNNYGIEMETLGEVKPVTGNSLVTTLDLDLQLAAETAMADQAGAVIAIDPLSGEILAMVSRPAFDPTLFSRGIKEDEWALLLSDPRKPLQNRAIQNRFSPGSVFKIFMTVAGLEEHAVASDDALFCRGAASFYGQSFDCWKGGGHGSIELHDALVHSCNVFFYNVGDRLGINMISVYATMMGLGRKTGIDLPSEVAGIMPSEEWRRNVSNAPWYPGETISVSIGQGPVSVTPLQLTWAVAGLVSGGNLPQPHLVDPNLVRELGFEVPNLKRERYPVQDSTVDVVRRALWGVVHEGGTGGRAEVKGFEVAGKTGTAQVVRKQIYDEEREEFEDHAWFVGFAPFDNPEIVVGVFVENGGHGGRVAAPVAQSVMQSYFDKQEKRLTRNQGVGLAQLERPDR